MGDPLIVPPPPPSNIKKSKNKAPSKDRAGLADSQAITSVRRVEPVVPHCRASPVSRRESSLDSLYREIYLTYLPPPSPQFEEKSQWSTKRRRNPDLE